MLHKLASSPYRENINLPASDIITTLSFSFVLFVFILKLSTGIMYHMLLQTWIIMKFKDGVCSISGLSIFVTLI